MTAFMIILCAVSLTASAFLIGKFAFKHQDKDEYTNIDSKN